MTTYRARQKTWAIISEDGRHVWMGRNSDPTDDEVVRAEKGLADQGLAGWLAIVEGDYWSRRGKLGFVMVKPLASPKVEFEAATVAFEGARRRRLAEAS
jgi:hypothetical protein